MQDAVRYQLSDCFGEIHKQLDLIRFHVEDTEDPEALEILESMERGCLGPMRQLRLKLDVPYEREPKRRESPF